MQVLLLLGALFMGAIFNLILKLKEIKIHTIAKIYVYVAILLSLSYWVLNYFAANKNIPVSQFLTIFIIYVNILGCVFLGFLTTYIITQFYLSSQNTHLLKNIIYVTLWGRSIITGNIFIIATLGKILGFKGISDFFISSGYSIGFLYFIMTAETLGGIGILMHFKLKTGPLAAAGLFLIMSGAVYTHWHNHDPFSDSYAAVNHLITISILETLYYYQRRTKAFNQ